MKKCTLCKRELALSEFSRDKQKSDGLRPQCRTCRRADTAAHYAANREDLLTRKKAYYAVHRGGGSAVTRARHLRRKYGLSVEAYTAMLAAQGHCCAICGDRAPEGQNLHVDHDHVTGAVRGLLCRFCNTRVVPAVERGLTYKATAYLSAAGG